MDGQAILARLEELLVEHIPHRIKEAAIKVPVYLLLAHLVLWPGFDARRLHAFADIEAGGVSSESLS